MGYIKHHAIVATAFDTVDINMGRREALRIFMDEQVSDVVASPVNGYYSFFIAPDGSKEGWNSSDEGDAHRAEFIKWCKEKKETDIYIDCAELMYGGDDEENGIININ